MESESRYLEDRDGSNLDRLSHGRKICEEAGTPVFAFEPTIEQEDMRRYRLLNLSSLIVPLAVDRSIMCSFLCVSDYHAMEATAGRSEPTLPVPCGLQSINSDFPSLEVALETQC